MTEGNETDFWQLSVSRSNCGELGHNIFCYNVMSRRISKEGVDGRFVDLKEIEANARVGLRAGNATPWRFTDSEYIQSERKEDGQKCWRKYGDQITWSTCNDDDIFRFDIQVQKTGAYNL